MAEYPPDDRGLEPSPRPGDARRFASGNRFAIVLGTVLLFGAVFGLAWYISRPSVGSAVSTGDDLSSASADSRIPTTPKGPLPKPPSDPLVNMVLVPAGTFLFGEEKREMDLPAFYIDRCEVSQAEYGRFLEFVQRTGDHSHCHPDEPRGKDHKPLYWGALDLSNPRFPVVGLDYWDVNAYVGWVGKRLPTEEEWEKAARGTAGQLYPWGTEWDPDRCNWGSPLEDRTLMPVDSLPEGRSPYGCFHMLGNAAEWTASFIDKSQGIHCGRGYCWRLSHWAPFVVTFRMPGETSLRDEGSGLRCALDVPQQPPTPRGKPGKR